jgi:hypothetical protein
LCLVAQVSFWLWWKKTLGVTYLPTIPVVPLCHFLVLAGNRFWLHSFQERFIWFLYEREDPLANVCIL